MMSDEHLTVKKTKKWGYMYWEGNVTIVLEEDIILLVYTAALQSRPITELINHDASGQIAGLPTRNK